MHMESQIWVVNARCFEESPVSHDERYLVIPAQRNTFVRYMFPVHIQRKMNEILMAGKGGSYFQIRKVPPRHHGGQEALGNRSQYGVGYVQRLRYSGKREIHEFSSR